MIKQNKNSFIVGIMGYDKYINFLIYLIYVRKC